MSGNSRSTRALRICALSPFKTERRPATFKDSTFNVLPIPSGTNWRGVRERGSGESLSLFGVFILLNFLASFSPSGAAASAAALASAFGEAFARARLVCLAGVVSSCGGVSAWLSAAGSSSLEAAAAFLGLVRLATGSGVSESLGSAGAAFARAWRGAIFKAVAARAPAHDDASRVHEPNAKCPCTSCLPKPGGTEGRDNAMKVGRK
mmetsp:Transcript_27631/g.79175  ORF Transcript_27631/g.79175 Transcript_27631/m.79175 type:complete len:207 (-) Transcript_27631:119-739(-)